MESRGHRGREKKLRDKILNKFIPAIHSLSHDLKLPLVLEPSDKPVAEDLKVSKEK